MLTLVGAHPNAWFCASALVSVGGGFSAAELEQVLTWGILPCFGTLRGSLGDTTVLRHSEGSLGDMLLTN
jgi:hypothetical protein